MSIIIPDPTTADPYPTNYLLMLAHQYEEKLKRIGEKDKGFVISVPFFHDISCED